MGKELQCQVVAENGIGTGAARSAAVTVAITPTRPGVISVVKLPYNRAQVRWGAATNASHYRIRVTRGTVTTEYIRTTRTLTLARIKPGTKFKVAVRAVSVDGISSLERVQWVTVPKA
jgi:hypothetical protein